METTSQQKYDNKLSRLVAYIENNIDYYKAKHGSRFVKRVYLRNNDILYTVKIVEYFITLNMDDNMIGSVILHSGSEQIERNDPEMADQLYNELIRVFEIPALNIVEYVLN